MSRRYYLSKNSLTKQYCLDDGNFGSRRKVIGKDEAFVISYLKENVNKKRNSEFYILKEDLSSEEIKEIRKFFSDTKVKVSLESRLKI